MSESGWYFHDPHEGDVIDDADDRRFRTFAHHFSREQVAKILRYTHWIPGSRGLTQKMMAADFPGHSFNNLLEVFHVAGISVPSPVGGPMTLDPRVAAVHFTSAESLAVQLEESGESSGIPTVGWARRGQPIDISTAFTVCTRCGALRATDCPFPSNGRADLTGSVDASRRRVSRHDRCACDGKKGKPVANSGRCTFCVICRIEVVQGHPTRRPVCPMCRRWALRMRHERRPDPTLPDDITSAELDAFFARMTARATPIRELCERLGLAEAPVVPLETYLDRARSEGLRHSTFRDISFGASWRPGHH